jgi:hypothetical protein
MLKKMLGLLLVPVFLAGLTACDVDVRDKGELPEVYVDAQAGKMPDVDVDVEPGKLPDVDVDAEAGKLPEVDVRGPDVHVGEKKVEVTVPDVDVDVPEEHENEPPRRP